MTRIVHLPLTPLNWINTYALVGDRIVIVDTGWPGAGQRVLAAMTRANLALTDVSLILLTHAHPDHVGGANQLRQALRAPVAVHFRDGDILRSGLARPLRGMNPIGQLAVRAGLVARQFTSVTPDVEFDDHFDLSRYGIEAEIRPTPGHTLGSVSIRLGSGEMVVGDALAGAMYWPTRPAYPPFHEDPGKARATVGQMLTWSPTRFYPGHGGPLAPREVANWLAFAIGRD